MKTKSIVATVALVAATLISLTACSGAPSIVGVWTASDGSSTKTINDGGACSGMYYNGTTPLDIGGPETCTLSSSQTDGYYSLVVSQPPNSATYQVTFSGNTMTLSSRGNEIVTLTKQ